MSLTTCKACGREVSTEAVSCPGCGQPFKKEKKALVSRPLGFLLQLAAAGLILWGLFGFVNAGDVYGAVVKLVVGAGLLFVGGRTKARV